MSRLRLTQAEYRCPYVPPRLCRWSFGRSCNSSLPVWPSSLDAGGEPSAFRTGGFQPRARGALPGGQRSPAVLSGAWCSWRAGRQPGLSERRWRYRQEWAAARCPAGAKLKLTEHCVRDKRGDKHPVCTFVLSPPLPCVFIPVLREVVLLACFKAVHPAESCSHVPS